MNRPTRRQVLAASAALAAAPARPAFAAASAAGPRRMPTSFESGIIFATPETISGQRLKLLTDTGGGLFLLESSLARLGLAGTGRKVKEGAQEFSLVRLAEFKPEAWIPAPIRGDGEVPAFPGEGELKSMADRGWDGMLGQAWFGDRIWTFDYPGEALTLHPVTPAPASGARETPLYFQAKGGRRSSHFPRIQAQIDGQTLDLLFDTGAQSPLTPEAKTRLGGTADLRASSFITRTIADGWRKAHPDWPVIEKGEAGMGADLVRVPNVRVAGFDSGPAWFAVRADRNFTEWMSQWMDRPIVGALGGSALQPFRITADYPASRAWFERV